METVIFRGSAPGRVTSAFADYAGVAYYPSSDSTWNKSARMAWAPNATWKDWDTIVYDATGDTQIVDDGTGTTTTVTDDEVQSVIEEIQFVKPKHVVVNAKLGEGVSNVVISNTSIPDRKSVV